MGDLYEDLLNINNCYLNTVVLVNSLIYTMTEPARGRPLLDQVITYISTKLY